MKRIFDFCVPGASAPRPTARIPFQSWFRKPELWPFFRNGFGQLFVVRRFGFVSLSLAISYTLPTFSASAMIHNIAQFMQKVFVHVASINLFLLFITHNLNARFLYRLTNVKTLTIPSVMAGKMRKTHKKSPSGAHAPDGAPQQFLILLL